MVNIYITDTDQLELSDPGADQHPPARGVVAGQPGRQSAGRPPAAGRRHAGRAAGPGAPLLTPRPPRRAINVTLPSPHTNRRKVYSPILLNSLRCSSPG